MVGAVVTTAAAAWCKSMMTGGKRPAGAMLTAVSVAVMGVGKHGDCSTDIVSVFGRTRRAGGDWRCCRRWHSLEEKSWRRGKWRSWQNVRASRHGHANGGRGGIGGGGGFGRRELELQIDGTIKGATDEVKEELAELGVLVLRDAGLGKWSGVKFDNIIDNIAIG